jgi:hypothetical protein
VGEGERDLSANTFTSARDQGNLASQIEIHRCFPP